MKQVLKLALALSLLITPAFSYAKEISAKVKDVIDGDTAVTTAGRVRYIGVDAPERGEPFYKEARRRNAELVRGKTVRISVCDEEPKDKYGRTLGFLYLNGSAVSEMLVKEGLARTLIVPPCGDKYEARLKKLESEAKAKKTNIWRPDGGYGGLKTIGPRQAERHIGEAVRVKGKVIEVKKTEKVVLLKLDGFTAVIFSGAFGEFDGVDFLKLKGRTVVVSGVVKEYEGRPEIIIKGPRQLGPG